MQPRSFNQRLAQTRHFLRFLIVGFINTVFGYIAFSLLLYSGLHYAVASFFSACAGILFNFNTTGRIVFKNSNHRLLVRFFQVYALLYLINLALLKLMVIFAINLYLGSAVIVLPMAFLSYVLNKKFVFNSHTATPKAFKIMIKFDPTRQLPHSFVIASAFLLLLLCYHLIFSSYFPNFLGRLGHDVSFVFPALLDGYFWFKNNSLFDVPWFTPSFCGGQPYFADVQSFYYSVPQFLTFFFDPLTSSYLSIILFASAGFWSMYVLLRRLFKTSNETAFLAASLFMFNGFYIHRMMVGHFGFQGFMLVPLIAFLLLHQSSDNPAKTKLSSLFNTVLVGVLIAYWLQSGLTSLMIPTSLAVLAIACLYNFGNWQSFLSRSLLAIIIALALSASKLGAGFAFMASFERSDYSLPGIDTLFDAVKLIFTTLFLSPSNIEEIAVPKLINLQWMLSRHEWEFGVTFIPLLIIAAAWLTGFWKQLHTSFTGLKNHSLQSWLSLAMLTVILLLPLALNIYTPEWNAILKQTPIIKSSSALIRWWLVYIPIVIVYAALSFEKLTFPAKYRPHLVAGSVLAIVVLNLIQDRMYYDMQGYDGNPVLQAYQQSEQGSVKPEIRFIATAAEVKKPNGRAAAKFLGNDTLAANVSQLSCYNPAFGYQLEKFPVKTLHTGNVFEQKDGYLNLKNPACYVYPDENQCRPGDHFKVSQKAEAELFVHYKPFHFEISLKQKIANWITQLTLGFVLVFLGYGLIRSIQQGWLFLVSALNHQETT